MADESLSYPFPDEMSDKIFSRFSTYIQAELGIKMPEIKKTMLQARLRKRLRKLGMGNFEEYYKYVFSAEGMQTELHHMIDVITTNKTDFFREPKHFEYLTQTTVPEFVKRFDRDSLKHLRVWSAGCSTGEEPYTLAMVLTEAAERYPGFSFSIIGTDISTRVLETAAHGIYEHERVEPVPLPFRKKYLLRNKDKNLIRVAPSLRAVVKFKRINLMDNEFWLPEKVDIVFFRNVMIYFDRPTQEKVLNRMCRHLNRLGCIFIGHSETLNGLNIPLIPISATVYRYQG